MPDGHAQEPGGWNRVVLQVANLPARIEALKKGGLHFRNQMETGPGGKQIQLEDPDGNPLELFERVPKIVHMQRHDDWDSAMAEMHVQSRGT